MNYQYCKSNNISVINNNNKSNQLLFIDNTNINNNFFIFDNNHVSPYLNGCENYNIEINQLNKDSNKKEIINYFYNELKDSSKKKNIINEEIKNVDSNNNIYQSNNHITKNHNIESNLNLFEINNNKTKLNKNLLYDFYISENNLYNNMKMLNNEQKINSFDKSHSQKRLCYNFLTDNPSANSLFDIKNNLISKNSDLGKINNNFNYNKKQNKERKIKKQIITNLKGGYLYNIFNNKKEKEIKINNIHITPEKDIKLDKRIFKENYKDNHINLIPIPIKLKNKNNLFPSLSEQKKNRNDNPKFKKKNKKNIDINIDCDENNQKKISHTKNISLILGNDPIYNNSNNLNNRNNKYFEQYINLNRNRSETRINNKIKSKIKYINNNDNHDDIKICKEINCRKKSSKSKIINNTKNNSNGVNLKILWEGKSQAGKDSNGNIKINQDSFKVCENINNIKYFNIYILCDGHGNNGHHVSKFVTEYIISKIANHPLIYPLNELNRIYEKLIELNYKIIRNIFSETDKYLSIQNIFDTYTSGTTCILILQIGTKLISANIGDSRAILIYSTNDFYNNTKIFPLSLDSKPDLPLEMKRIITCGGEVHRGKNRKGNYVGPMRVFAKGKDYPGLAMSRSFGDFKSKEYGVICEPSFVEYNMDEYCQYIVLCSDGVWDFIDNENVMKIGNKHYLNNNPNGFCQEILGNASYWWEKEDIVIDDITALIVFFKF